MKEFRELTEEELKRYNRNILVKEIGLEGQKKLAASSVLVIGTGGLGSPVTMYLTAAGVGTLGIADFDKVDITNLQRQIIHFTKDIGKSKVDSAYEKLHSLNPDINVIPHKLKLDKDNIHGIIRDYDFIIDATDNFESKFLINDACVKEEKPFSHGGVLALEGQTMTVIPHKTACYRCIFGDVPDEEKVDISSRVGILGSIAGILGTIQATEAIKYITGAGELLAGTLLVFDARNFDFRKIKINRNDECKVCGIK